MSTDVSIVVPIFNSSKYIIDTITSISEATNGLEYEILLVDDCSKDIDNIKKIIENFKHTKLIQKNFKTNAADSRNIGYLASKGKYVFFLDSDDRFLPDTITRRVELHEKLSVGVIFGNFNLKSGNNIQKSNLPPYHNQDMRYYLFQEAGDFRTSTISISKEHFKGTTFDEQSKKHQDWIYAIRCWNNGESIYLDNLSSVVITTDINTNRMSNKYNFEASQYLCENYLIDQEVINDFSTKHWKQIIIKRDKEACDFFFGLYVPQNRNEFIQYKLYTTLARKHILPVSSWCIRKAKDIKNSIQNNEIKKF